jgi:predicted nucleic acid-binding protein
VIYLLDTSANGALMREDARMASWRSSFFARAKERRPWARATYSSIGVDGRVVMCTMVRGEILFGLERLAPGRRRAELEEKAGKLFAVLPCEPIPPVAGDRYANVKISKQRRGLRLKGTRTSSAN